MASTKQSGTDSGLTPGVPGAEHNLNALFPPSFAVNQPVTPHRCEAGGGSPALTTAWEASLRIFRALHESHDVRASCSSKRPHCANKLYPK